MKGFGRLSPTHGGGETAGKRAPTSLKNDAPTCEILYIPRKDFGPKPGQDFRSKKATARRFREESRRNYRVEWRCLGDAQNTSENQGARFPQNKNGRRFKTGRGPIIIERFRRLARKEKSRQCAKNGARGGKETISSGAHFLKAPVAGFLKMNPLPSNGIPVWGVTARMVRKKKSKTEKKRVI